MVTNLRCEYASNPLGIDVTSPRFSWQIVHPQRGQLQSAYQVLVASNESNLGNNTGDMWDSGKVESGESVNVVYQGKSLKSGKRCYWKVRVWDKDEGASSWSNPVVFEMGLLNPDDWQGVWIGAEGGKTEKALLFRKVVTLGKPVARGRVYICGLGYYELRLNGEKVDNHVLDPGWTEYTKRVLYVTYDVTGYLRKGENAVGIILGNGWYGIPRMIFQMNVEFINGTSTHIVSDCSWSVASSPITKNSIYDGEVYDARLEKPRWDTPSYTESPEEWLHAQRVEDPSRVMKGQMLEPIKVVEIITPVDITNPKPAIYVYDMGQNIAGWCRLTVEGPRNTEVVLKFAEILYEDGTVNQENLRTAKATDTYILKGEAKEVYEPRFTYHGFRYVQVTGFPGRPTLKNLEGRVVRSAVELVGKFTCSNDLLNKIHKNIVWTESNNLHSVPTDCPQRNERMGWLNDATVRAEEAIYNFNMARLYTKWLKDIRDAQDKKTGAIADTAPFRWGSRPGDPVDCYLFIVWHLYQYYEDRRILEEHYQGIKHWVDFLGTQAKDYIIPYTLYGDWCTPIKDCIPADSPKVPPDSRGAVISIGSYPANTPGSLISTGYYYYNALILSRIARILGKIEDAAQYAHLAEKTKESFTKRFFNANTAQYATGSQGCNALPLFLDLVPEDKKEALVQNLVKDIMEKHKGHLNTGNQCTKYMMEVLTELGEGDVAYTIVTQISYPSWGYMISKGATTIWERWEYMTGSGMNSHDHPMHGSVDVWFYKYLAGIKVDLDNPGWKSIIIKPYILGDLTFVEGSVNTVRGLIFSKWERKEGLITLEVKIPVNSRARVSVPTMGWSKMRIEESGKPVWENNSYVQGVEGIREACEDKGYVTFRVESGSYFFKVKNKKFHR